MHKFEVDHISSSETALVVVRACYVRVYMTQSSDCGNQQSKDIADKPFIKRGRNWNGKKKILKNS